MPPRVAVVGAGPAGFYSALRLLLKQPKVHIDIFEKQVVPFGLARFGVAPDHPEVKNCEERFVDVAQSPNVRFFGNVEVGKAVSVRELLENYNAVLFSYGAQDERQLGVPGSDHAGVFSARDFVAWYNGDPRAQDLQVPLNEAEHVTVVGNGNVALDVARILLRTPSELRHTDITETALATLASSKVKHVSVVGRRGLLQSSFTNKELRELFREPGVAFQTTADASGAEFASEIAGRPLGRADKRKVDLLRKGSDTKLGSPEADRSWDLTFLRSPREIVGSPGSRILEKVDWTINELAYVEDKAVAKATSKTVSTPTDLVMTSIGYRSHALEGMASAGIPFNTLRGVIENKLGRVGNTNAFVAGWVKTGPTGVIASTMMDSFAVGEEIAAYLDTEQEQKAGSDGLHITSRSVSWNDWLKIDKVEQERGKTLGKPREKITSNIEMLELLG